MLHPRSLTRLSRPLLQALVKIIHECERFGVWPKATGVVVIVLLPKPDGRWRPIGLLPWMPRVWMRARKGVADAWLRQHTRAFVYAGPAKGAEVAAWKQAARAELAKVSNGVDYAQVLLDLARRLTVSPTMCACGRPSATVSRCGYSGCPLPLIGFSAPSASVLYALT